MQETGKHYEKAYWTNRQKLQYISGIVIITVSVIAGFKYVFPFVAPFVIAYAVAVMIEKPVNRLARVFKGRKMAGHWGAEQVTVQGLEIVDVRAEDNVILIRGSVPGPKNGLVLVRKQ